nr:O-antigen polymerase [Plesiomonas shigelloides]
MPYNKVVILKLIVILQLTTLLVYLNANIVNVGKMGVALHLLIAFVGFSILLFVMFWTKKKLYFHIHFFLFLLLMCWVAFRVALDLSDLYYLKQLTVATTGGILLFYVIGALLGLTMHELVNLRNDINSEKYIILLFCFLSIWMLYNFSQRLDNSLFYLRDVDGSYQRPGNFLSISFIVISFAYLNLVLKYIAKGATILASFFWFFVYNLSTLMVLVGSQLFGSNSATGVILGVYLITLVMSLTTPKKTLWLSYIKHELALPWSKRLVKNLSLMALMGLAILVGILVLIIDITGFDITSLQLLGLGSGTNTSLLSRIDILLETGAEQLSYAPLLGDINVAYLTTGNSGLTLHNFFPYVMANLGLVGLIIVLALFTSVLLQLYRKTKQVKCVGFYGYQLNMVVLYSIFVFLYILFFANLSTDVSWPVLWFTLGFISKPFGFK